MGDQSGLYQLNVIIHHINQFWGFINFLRNQIYTINFPQRSHHKITL